MKVASANMTKWLELGAGLTALIAAVFWFLSAYGEVPPVVSYFDRAPDSDPLMVAMRSSANMNRWAAAFSGVSAMLVSVSLFLRE